MHWKSFVYHQADVHSLMSVGKKVFRICYAYLFSMLSKAHEADGVNGCKIQHLIGKTELFI